LLEVPAQVSLLFCLAPFLNPASCTFPYALRLSG
jgi:hypothetical protein